ncbi:YdcF family protein [Paenibacillus donghaensis]|uniref:DUF218 domain-containing protein n=1 Tax=Paenibacillus donghaensis TaxID=414771 RepID=A0A2Z2KKE0_9BACL|nr:YdcF family protein [Paenibacillus donghaensis]ASA23800.1 hypothetical protein B9T62_25270 [Paenibacillus donghaensis]
MLLRPVARSTSRSGKKKLWLLLPVLPLLLFVFTAGRFLPYSQPPQQADVIIVLSGGAERVEKAVELYNTGYAPFLILSNSKQANTSQGDMLQTALALKVNENAILTEEAATSTYENATLTLPIMKEKGFTSAIVVSSDFHMRRVKFIFDHVYKNSAIELTYVSSDSGYNSKAWWKGAYNREKTYTEYIKMIGNALGYNGPEAKKVLDKIKRWFN